MEAALSIPVQNEVLNSWKEIAQYLERGVRTVQRWETDLALPVRRPRGKKRSAVIAMRCDIDDWLNSCPFVKSGQVDNAPLTTLSGPANDSALQIPVSETILRSRCLRRDVRRSRHELAGAIGRLVSNLHAVVNASSANPASSGLVLPLYVATNDGNHAQADGFRSTLSPKGRKTWGPSCVAPPM